MFRFGEKQPATALWGCRPLGGAHLPHPFKFIYFFILFHAISLITPLNILLLSALDNIPLTLCVCVFFFMSLVGFFF